MNKLSIFTTIFLLTGTFLLADNNETIQVDAKITIIENNQTVDVNNTKENELRKQVEEQMKREEKYAQEQVFYQGADYDLKSREINEKSLEKLERIEPDFDFEMDDVYRDDL